MTSVDECGVCGANHMMLGAQIGCGRSDHGHRLLFHSVQGDRVLYQCPAYRCATRITAPRHPEPSRGEPMTAIHHPQVTQPATELAIRDDQQRFDKYQLAALRARGIENVPNAELAVFFHYCKSRGLDPFAGHATITPFREPDGSQRWTIITEIDGYRHIGHRAANRRGSVVAIGAPVYFDMDGDAYPHWVRQGPPGMVEVTIVVDGAPFTGQANYFEFRKLHPKTGEPMGLWAKMPANQTRKCAEAQAWRMAFQAEFAGIPAELPIGAAPEPVPWHEAATVPALPDGTGAAALAAQWERIGITSPDEQLNLTAALAGTDTILDGLGDVPAADALRIAAQLADCDNISQVHALISGGDKP